MQRSSLREGIKAFDGFQQRRIPVGDDQFQVLPQETPALEIREESLPGSLILRVRQLKRENILLPFVLVVLLPMDGKGTEHHLLLNADLPNLLAQAVQEEKLDRVLNRFILESGKRLIQRRQGGADRLGTDLFAGNLPGDPFELAGAYSIEKEPAQGGVHIPAAMLIAIKDAEGHPSFFRTGHADLVNDAVSGQ